MRSEILRKEEIIDEKDKEIALNKIQFEEKKFECDQEKTQGSVDLLSHFTKVKCDSLT